MSRTAWTTTEERGTPAGLRIILFLLNTFGHLAARLVLVPVVLVVCLVSVAVLGGPSEVVLAGLGVVYVTIPTGEVLLVSWGMLNLTHRDSHEQPGPLEPGKRYHVAVQLRMMGYQLAAGHQWRIGECARHHATAP